MPDTTNIEYNKSELFIDKSKGSDFKLYDFLAI